MTAFRLSRPSKPSLTTFEVDVDVDAVELVEEMGPEAISSADAAATPVVKLTNLIIRDAIAQSASDIHIEPGRWIGVVRYRVDGVLRKHMDLPMTAMNRVISRIKILARLDIADRLRPQDGKAHVRVQKLSYDLRVSTQDPDIILIGEIRDVETAETASHAAMTGHLVLATVHANDAVSAVARMADMGLPYATIGTTLERRDRSTPPAARLCILRRVGAGRSDTRGAAPDRAT